MCVDLNLPSLPHFEFFFFFVLNTAVSSVHECDDVWPKSTRSNEKKRKKVERERRLSLCYYQRHSITTLIFARSLSLFVSLRYVV